MNGLQKINLGQWSRLLIGLLAVLVSCHREEPEDTGFIADKVETAHIKFFLQLPQGAVSTYAVSDIDENAIAAIDILAFKESVDPAHAGEYGYAYHVRVPSSGINADADPSIKVFETTLQKTAVQQKLVFLANAGAQVDALGTIAEGTPKDTVINKLVYSSTGAWSAKNGNQDFTPFPMWGEVNATLNTQQSSISDIRMTRGLSRVDVVIAENLKNSGSFTLKEVNVYNSKTRGRVVPSPENYDEVAGKVMAVSLPAGDINNSSPLVYTVPSGMEYAFEGAIYLFEAGSLTAQEASNATCLVLGGFYGNDSYKTYYRIDFFQKDAAGNYTGDYRALLRNHQYRANIVSVLGRGALTKEEAFNSKHVNMVAEITGWEDGDFGDVVIDGVFQLRVSPSSFTFTKEAQPSRTAKNSLNIYTDFVSATLSGWKVEKIVDAVDRITPLNWLSVQPTATGAPDVDESRWLKLEENTTGKTRSALVFITAGKLSYELEVRQVHWPSVQMSVTDVWSNPITELLFPLLADELPETKLFILHWAPPTAEVQVSTAPVIGALPFAFSPASEQIADGVISNAQGTKICIVQPAAIPAAALAADPFKERKTTVTYTVYNDELEMRNATLVLRQANNIVPDISGPYYMDGGTYSFKVKANIAWKASVNANSTGYIATLNVATGAPETLTGRDLVFTTTTNGQALAPATLTLESVTAGQYPPREVAVNCLPGHAPGSTATFSDFHPYRNAPTGATWTLVDERDNKTYPGVKMADGRIWMAKNLNYTGGLTFRTTSTSPSTVSGLNTALIGSYWCPGADQTTTGNVAACNTYGALYSWETAMLQDGLYNANKSKSGAAAWVEPTVYCTGGTCTNNANVAGRGICPPGWHVPTDAEWGIMFNALEDNAGDQNHLSGKAYCGRIAGAKLKTSGCGTATDTSPLWECQNTGTNVSGFSALPAGERSHQGGNFIRRGVMGVFWTASLESSTNVWHRAFHQIDSRAVRNIWPRSTGYPVRCIRD